VKKQGSVVRFLTTGYDSPAKNFSASMGSPQCPAVLGSRAMRKGGSQYQPTLVSWLRVGIAYGSAVVPSFDSEREKGVQDMVTIKTDDGTHRDHYRATVNDIFPDS
jgi:hypothetical protein